MQLLAIGTGEFVLLTSLQATIFVAFGVAVAVGVALFIIARNNVFIKRKIDKLTKKLNKTNEKLNQSTNTETELKNLNAQKAKLEQKIDNLMCKACGNIKYKSKRFNNFSIYVEKHAQKYPNLFNTLQDKNNLKDLFDAYINEIGLSKSAKKVTEVKKQRASTETDTDMISNQDLAKLQSTSLSANDIMFKKQLAKQSLDFQNLGSRTSSSDAEREL